MVILMGRLHRSPSQICHNPLLPAPQQAESRAPDHQLGSYLSSLTVGVGADGESRTRTTLAGLRILSPLRSPSHVRIRWPTRLFVQPLRPFGRCHTHARLSLVSEIYRGVKPKGARSPKRKAGPSKASLSTFTLSHARGSARTPLLEARQHARVARS